MKALRVSVTMAFRGLSPFRSSFYYFVGKAPGEELIEKI